MVAGVRRGPTVRAPTVGTVFRTPATAGLAAAAAMAAAPPRRGLMGPEIMAALVAPLRTARPVERRRGATVRMALVGPAPDMPAVSLTRVGTAGQATNGPARTALGAAAAAVKATRGMEHLPAVLEACMVGEAREPGGMIRPVSPPPAALARRASSSSPTRPRARQPSFRMHRTRPSFWRAQQPET